MASSIQYTCDHCRKPKGTANHWFCLQIAPEAMLVTHWESGHRLAGMLHLCGQECLHAEISSAIAAGQGQQVFRQRPAAEQVISERGEAA